MDNQFPEETQKLPQNKRSSSFPSYIPSNLLSLINESINTASIFGGLAIPFGLGVIGGILNEGLKQKNTSDRFESWDHPASYWDTKDGTYKSPEIQELFNQLYGGRLDTQVTTIRNSELKTRVNQYLPSILAIDGMVVTQMSLVERMPFIWCSLPDLPRNLNPKTRTIYLIAGDPSSYLEMISYNRDVFLSTNTDCKSLIDYLSTNASTLIPPDDIHRNITLAEILTVHSGVTLLIRGLGAWITRKIKINNENSILPIMDRRKFLERSVVALSTVYLLDGIVGLGLSNTNSTREKETAYSQTVDGENKDLAISTFLRDPLNIEIILNGRTAILISKEMEKRKELIDKGIVALGAIGSTIMGYNHSDTAELYLNDNQLRIKAIKQYAEFLISNIKLFVTTNSAFKDKFYGSNVNVLINNVLDYLCLTQVIKITDPSDSSISSDALKYLQENITASTPETSTEVKNALSYLRASTS